MAENMGDENWLNNIKTIEDILSGADFQNREPDAVQVTESKENSQSSSSDSELDKILQDLYGGCSSDDVVSEFQQTPCDVPPHFKTGNSALLLVTDFSKKNGVIESSSNYENQENYHQDFSSNTFLPCEHNEEGASRNLSQDSEYNVVFTTHTNIVPTVTDDAYNKHSQGTMDSFINNCSNSEVVSELQSLPEVLPAFQDKLGNVSFGSDYPKKREFDIENLDLAIKKQRTNSCGSQDHQRVYCQGYSSGLLAKNGHQLLEQILLGENNIAQNSSDSAISVCPNQIALEKTNCSKIPNTYSHQQKVSEPVSYDRTPTTSLCSERTATSVSDSERPHFDLTTENSHPESLPHQLSGTLISPALPDKEPMAYSSSLPSSRLVSSNLKSLLPVCDPNAASASGTAHAPHNYNSPSSSSAPSCSFQNKRNCWKRCSYNAVVIDPKLSVKQKNAKTAKECREKRKVEQESTRSKLIAVEKEKTELQNYRQFLCWKKDHLKSDCNFSNELIAILGNKINQNLYVFRGYDSKM